MEIFGYINPVLGGTPWYPCDRACALESNKICYLGSHIHCYCYYRSYRTRFSRGYISQYRIMIVL